jgi:hypothetical protein
MRNPLFTEDPIESLRLGLGSVREINEDPTSLSQASEGSPPPPPPPPLSLSPSLFIYQSTSLLALSRSLALSLFLLALSLFSRYFSLALFAGSHFSMR